VQILVLCGRLTGLGELPVYLDSNSIISFKNRLHDGFELKCNKSVFARSPKCARLASEIEECVDVLGYLFGQYNYLISHHLLMLAS
jgi:hypothetical protein